MEVNRQLLEEANTIENAAAQRFRRNPALREVASVQEKDADLSGTKRSHKETLGQAHELKYFASQYEQNCARLGANLNSDSLKSDISSMEDPDMKFAPLLSMVKAINAKYHDTVLSEVNSLGSQYDMYSSVPSEHLETKNKKRRVKRKYFLSSATEFVEAQLQTSFNESEMLGKYVDLTMFYEMFKPLSENTISYPEYLRTFTQFKVSAKSHDYTKYLESLLLYLRKFAENTLPLQDLGTPEKEESSMKDGQVNENGEVYCKPCNKMFSKQTVYDGHLNGKRHKKLATGTAPSEAQTPSFRVMEKEIVHLHKILREVIEITANDYERRSRMSEREKQIELDAIEGNQSDYTSFESSDGENNTDGNDSDDELRSSYDRDLPLGADGIPIPLWLYKLQGLHKSYSCEICGNQEYKGRQQFDKHFGQARHLHGLKCLGISDESMPLFSSVTGIEEAQKLWQNVKANLRAQEEETVDAIEMEDETGNVMSHSDYVELKKQGLI